MGGQGDPGIHWDLDLIEYLYNILVIAPSTSMSGATKQRNVSQYYVTQLFVLKRDVACPVQRWDSIVRRSYNDGTNKINL